MSILVWLVLALVAAVAAALIATLTKAVRPHNAAIALVVGAAVSATALHLYQVAFTTGWSRKASSTAAELVFVTAVFVMLGLWEQVAADLPPRARALPRVVGGACFALLALAGESEMEWAFVGALLVNLSATLFGALDAAPRRAALAFLVGAGVLLFPVGYVSLGVAIGLGAVAGVMPRFGVDVLGRPAALGMGAFLGWALIRQHPHEVWLVVAGVVALLNVVVAAQRRR